MRIAGILLLLTLIPCIFVGCQQAPQGLSAADEQAIRKATDEALQIANATADWVAYTKTYYTQDAVINGPNAPAIKGHDAIIAMFKSFPAIEDYKAKILEIDGAGNIAYVYGTYSMVVTLPEGKPMPDNGKYVEIWKRQADGAWKVAIDTFNSDLPLPSPEPMR